MGFNWSTPGGTIASRRCWRPGCCFSFGYHTLAKRGVSLAATSSVWAITDVAMVTAVLFLADGAASPLVVAYPMLIVGAGLWFKVRYVSLVAALSITGYLALVADYYWRRTELQAQFDTHGDRHAFFVIMLIAVAAVVAYQVLPRSGAKSLLRKPATLNPIYPPILALRQALCSLDIVSDEYYAALATCASSCAMRTAAPSWSARFPVVRSRPTSRRASTT